MADPKPSAQNRIVQGQTRVASAPVSAPEEPEVVESSVVDPMEAFEARMETRMREAEARAEARIRAAEEKAEKAVKYALDMEAEAKVRIAAAEAAAMTQVKEAERLVAAATSPGAQVPVKISARGKEDVEVLCLKTQSIVRAGGRTYEFKADEVVSMDPSHAVEYESTGWVKRLKHNRR